MRKGALQQAPFGRSERARTKFIIRLQTCAERRLIDLVHEQALALHLVLNGSDEQLDIMAFEQCVLLAISLDNALNVSGQTLPKIRIPDQPQRREAVIRQTDVLVDLI